MRLILGDCLEIMKMLPDKSVDAVITDPPYGVGKAFANDEFTNTTLLKDVFSELYRIAKDDSFLISDWARQKILMLPDFIGDWEFLDLLAVAQENTMAFCRVGFDVFQSKFLLGKGNPKIVKRGWNLYKTVRKAGLPKFDHPTMKQVDVYEKVVAQFARPSSTVLDPFMGSGTTGVACVQTGRDFIGIEIDPGYFAIAEKRIKEAQAQFILPIEART